MTNPVIPTPIPDFAGTLPDPSDPDTFTERGLAWFNHQKDVQDPGINQAAQDAYINALSANEAAILAYLNANFKGAWSGLTGALNIPALVSHAGERWVLLNNLVNVTTSTPGVSADWELFELPAAAGVGFDPSGTSRTETNVQTMLTGVANDATTALVEFENPVLNGDMRVAQSGVSFSCSTGSTKVIDGWLFGMAGSAVVTVSQQSASTPDNANAKWLIGTVATADAAIASGDFGFLHQRIEGFDIAEYVGQTFTVGAWVKSSVTGVHSICLRNSGFDRYYVGQVNILAANTPQFATLTITGGLPVSGTWDFSNGVGLELGFVLASGSGFHGTVGSWQTGANIASAAQVNALGTIGNVFGITEVQINPGTTAKKFKRPAYRDSLERSKRYYREEPFFLNGYGIAGTVAGHSVAFGQAMRTDIGAIAQSLPAYTNCTSNSLVMLTGAAAFARSVTVTATGNYSHSGKVVLDRRL
jgi:hypothetical protein